MTFPDTSPLCRGYRPIARSRRDMLRQSAAGFGAVALSALLHEQAFGLDGVHGLHHRAKVRSIIFLYMDGGPSQVDTFDPKPLLDQYDGQDPSRLFTVEATQ